MATETDAPALKEFPEFPGEPMSKSYVRRRPTTDDRVDVDRRVFEPRANG
jgi:hypothetical protein